MVAHAAIPMFKLGALLVKQISKPIANTVKDQAKSSPIFRKYVCLPPAQIFNWFEVQMKMWMLRMGQPVNITVLNEAQAIELGANILGEGVIFLIASGLLISEYARSARKEAAKEEAKREELNRIRENVRDLSLLYEEHRTRMMELTRKIHDLESRMVTKPWVPKSAIKDDNDNKPPEGPSSEIVISEENPNQSNQEISNGKEDAGELRDTAMRSNIVLLAVNNLEKLYFYDFGANTYSKGVLLDALDYFFEHVYQVPLQF